MANPLCVHSCRLCIIHIGLGFFQRLSSFKGAQAREFGSEFLTPSKYILMATYDLAEKSHFVTFCARFDVFSAKIVLSAFSARA
jgi:hypothetical protein